MAIAESNKPPMPFAIAPTQAVPQAGTHSLPHDAALAHVHNLADFARLEADWRELESQMSGDIAASRASTGCRAGPRST